MTSFVGLRGVWVRLVGGKLEARDGDDEEKKRRELLCGRVPDEETQKFDPDSTQSMMAIARRMPPPNQP